MIVYVVFVIGLVFYNCKLNVNGFNRDYISKNQCNAVKGIFILLIIASHYFNNYFIGEFNYLDNIY